MNAHLSSLQGHANGKKHSVNMRIIVPSVSITDSLRPKQLESCQVAELKLAVFIAGTATTYFIAPSA